MCIFFQDIDTNNLTKEYALEKLLIAVVMIALLAPDARLHKSSPSKSSSKKASPKTLMKHFRKLP